MISVWTGTTLGDYNNVQEVAEAITALVGHPEQEHTWIVKAGEGGTWQNHWDKSRLAPGPPISSASHSIAELWLDGQALRPKLHVVPYVVLRGRPEWREAEIQQIVDCAYCERVILNLEPGDAYWNGPLDPAGVEDYLAGISSLSTKLELAVIPRLSAINALGGLETFQTWLNHVDGACWETYGATAFDLNIDRAMRLLDQWFPGNPHQWDSEYRIPIIEAAEITDGWLNSSYAWPEIQVFHL